MSATVRSRWRGRDSPAARTDSAQGPMETGRVSTPERRISPSVGLEMVASNTRASPVNTSVGEVVRPVMLPMRFGFGEGPGGGRPPPPPPGVAG